MKNNLTIYYKTQLLEAFENLSNIQLILIIIGLTILYAVVSPIYAGRLLQMQHSSVKVGLVIFCISLLLMTIFVIFNLIMALYLRRKCKSN
jgi:hypothetical protein